MNEQLRHSIPLGLYIHLPWCVKKCPYCDFNSHALKDDLPEEAYINALLKDFERQYELANNRSIDSIFIGGGTPSLFSGKAIDQLMTGIKQRAPISTNAEITMEANPGASDQERFSAYRQSGINRLSIGIQSFNAQHLRSLGRIHNPQMALEAITFAKKAGFTRINVDIMHSLPEQTINEGLADLQKAITSQVTHISWYQLTIEPNTHFARFTPKLPSHDQQFELEQQGKSQLQQHGFTQYEVSAFTKNNQHAQHNLNYWLFGDYLGIGAGAHSKITQNNHCIQREWRIKHPKKYLANQQNPIAGKNTLSANEKRFEFMLNALRLEQPVSFKLFEQRTGLKKSTLNYYLEKAYKKELLTEHPEQLIKTKLGGLFLNDLITLFMPPE